MKRRAFQFMGNLLIGAAIASQLASAQKGERSSRTVFVHPLPVLDGGKLTTEVVEVLYGPGGASPAHSHSCPVIGYVLEGAVKMQVDGQSPHIYRAGESFYEAPHGIHRVSANASTTVPAKFLAVFVCDGHAPLSSPIPGDAQ